MQVVGSFWTKLPRWLSRETNLRAFTVGADDLERCDIKAIQQSGVGPAIIGGIGDSGTRGVAQLLQDGFGFEMCPKPHKCNKARDSALTMKLSGRHVLEATNGSLFYTLDQLGKLRIPVLQHLCLAAK